MHFFRLRLPSETLRPPPRSGSPIRLWRGVVRALGLWLAFTFASETLSAGTLKILVRYDDYTSKSATHIEKQLFEAVHRAGSRTLVGVIPFESAPYPQGQAVEMELERWLGPAKSELLRTYLDAGVLTLGLHGFAHHENAITEFRGMPDDRQRQLMAIGQRAFEKRLGTRANVFIPPYNTYDESTLAAATANGIGVLAAGGYVPLSDEPSVQILPGGVYPSRLAQTVAAALKRNDMDGIVFVLAHDYDFLGGRPLPAFRGSDRQYPMERFVEDISRLRATPGVRFVSVEDLLGEPEKFSRSRLNMNLYGRSVVIRYQLLPEFLDLYATPGVYYSEERARGIHRRLWIATTAIYGGLAALCAVTLVALRRRYARQLDRASGWLLAGFVAAAVYGGLHLVFNGGYTRTVILVTLCLGAALGLGLDRVASMTRRRLARSTTGISTTANDR